MRSSTLTWLILDVVRSLSDRSTTSRRAESCLRTKNTKAPASAEALYSTVGADLPAASASTNRAATSYPPMLGGRVSRVHHADRMTVNASPTVNVRRSVGNRAALTRLAADTQ